MRIIFFLITLQLSCSHFTRTDVKCCGKVSIETKWGGPICKGFSYSRIVDENGNTMFDKDEFDNFSVDGNNHWMIVNTSASSSKMDKCYIINLITGNFYLKLARRVGPGMWSRERKYMIDLNNKNDSLRYFYLYEFGENDIFISRLSAATDQGEIVSYETQRSTLPTAPWSPDSTSIAFLCGSTKDPIGIGTTLIQVKLSDPNNPIIVEKSPKPWYELTYQWKGGRPYFVTIPKE